jgi:ribosomal protein L22
MVDEKKMDNEKVEVKTEVVKDVKKDAPKGVPPAQVASDKSDKVGKKKKTVKKAEPVKKDVAIANGFGMKISPKQCKYTCRVIRGKSPDAAVARLQAVIDEKRPVPMAGLEVGHKRGKGLAGGKFPKNACKGIMEIVKQAAANAVVAGIENPVIAIAKSNQASAPYRKAGRKAKRTHIYIEIRDKVRMMEAKKKEARK